MTRTCQGTYPQEESRPLSCGPEMGIVERSRGRRYRPLATRGTPLALPLLLSLALALPWQSRGASDCLVTVGAHSFDLSELAGAVHFRSKAPESSGWIYSFSACGGSAAAVAGGTSCAASPPSAVLQQTQNECKGLGAPDTRIVTTIGNGLSLSFSGGDGGRSVLIEIECADVMWPQVMRWGGGAAPGSYAALVRARAGCALACARTSEGAVCGGEANGTCGTVMSADITKCTCNVGRTGAACTELIHPSVAMGTAPRMTSGGLDFSFIGLCTIAAWLGIMVLRFVLLADNVSAADPPAAALSGASSCWRALQFAALAVGLVVAGLSVSGEFQEQTHNTTFILTSSKQRPSPPAASSQDCLKAFPGLTTTWGKGRGGPEPTHNIPIYVISFNNPTFLKRMLFQAACFNTPTVIVDNDSDFIPHKKLLGELNRSGVPVYHLQNKGAHTIFSDPSLFESLPPYFAVSDADIKFNPYLPRNYLEVMAQLSGAWGTKVGFALDISSPKFHKGTLGQHIRAHEEQFWKESLDTLKPLAAFNAQIDTTFAVYSKARALERQACTKAACNWFDYDAVRLAGNFTSEHTPWLADFFASWDSAEITASYGNHGVKQNSGSTIGGLMREHNLTAALTSSPGQQGAWT